MGLLIGTALSCFLTCRVTGDSWEVVHVRGFHWTDSLSILLVLSILGSTAARPEWLPCLPTASPTA